MAIDVIGTDDTDYSEAGAAAVGAQVVGMYLARNTALDFTNPMTLGLIGGGAALGIAAMNYSSSPQEGYKRNVDLQDAVLVAASTGGIMYFFGETLSRYMGPLSMALPGVVGFAGNLAAQQLPKLDFLQNIWKRKPSA